MRGGYGIEQHADECMCLGCMRPRTSADCRAQQIGGEVMGDTNGKSPMQRRLDTVDYAAEVSRAIGLLRQERDDLAELVAELEPLAEIGESIARQAAAGDLVLAIAILAKHGAEEISLGCYAGPEERALFEELASKLGAKIVKSQISFTGSGVNWILTWDATVAGKRVRAQCSGDQPTAEEILEDAARRERQQRYIAERDREVSEAESRAMAAATAAKGPTNVMPTRVS